jgi:cytochrome c-type biogenesis protein CcmH
MTFWAVLVLLCLVALGFVVWPLYRSSGRLTPLIAVVIVGTVALSAILYYEVGQPGIPSGAATSPDTTVMVAALAKRLKDQPDDVDGWVLLGRSYQSLGDYDQAIKAFETAFQLQQGQNPVTMVALAIALMEQEGGQVSDRATRLFENALALDPTNANALFYSGGAAAQRGDTALAAERWEMLLQQDAPPEIHDLLQRKINEWRGLPATDAVTAARPEAAIVSVHVTLSEQARAAMPAEATVFVIARDPAQPSPPVAVVPRRLSELPATVALSDKNAMIAARPLSGLTQIELLARVSMSGSPAAQSGDWFGALVVNSGGGQTIDLVIDQEVP